MDGLIPAGKVACEKAAATVIRIKSGFERHYAIVWPLTGACHERHASPQETVESDSGRHPQDEQKAGRNLCTQSQ